MDNAVTAIKSFWGITLRKISPEKIGKYAFSPMNTIILLEIGLPLGSELISFYDEDMMKECNLDSERYFLIGDDYGTQIGISLNTITKDEIHSFDVSLELPKRFVNSDASKLLEFLALYQNLKSSLAGSTDEEAMPIIANIKDEFNKTDPKALSNEDNWWSTILEQHELGIM